MKAITQSIKTKEHAESFSMDISTIKIKKYLSLNYNYSCSKKYGNNKFTKQTHPAWANDIGFDEKSKQDIKNLYSKEEPNKETVERYGNQQLQLQLQNVIEI